MSKATSAALVYDALGQLHSTLYDNKDYPNETGVPYYGPITTPPDENTLLSYARSHLWRSFRSDPTGLIWMGARYYSPRTTRFLSPDPIGASNCLNLYHYAYGDPINYHDPDGRSGSAVYHSPAAQSPLVQAASLAMMHCTDPQFQSALHTSGHYLFHPRMMGALQMAGGFAEASIGTGLMGTPFAPLGAFLMLHGADHMATGFRSLTSGQHARTLTTSGLMQMGLSESSASMIDAGIGMAGSAVGMGLRATQGALQLGSIGSISQNVAKQYGPPTSNVPSLRVNNYLSNNPLENTRYAYKVQKQMRLDATTALPDYHAFPRIVDNYASLSIRQTFRGRDSIERTRLMLEGSYHGKEGYFEWIIEPSKQINHRFFNPHN